MADQLNRPPLQPGVRGRARGRARPEDLPGTLRTSVGGIRDVLVRIRIPGSVPLTNGSRSCFAPLCDLFFLAKYGRFLFRGRDNCRNTNGDTYLWFSRF
jgi:hypothetical protein